MIPENEQGVVSLFSSLADELGYTFRHIGTKCPDAILEKDGKPVRVEFEYASKSFVAHKHDPADVDLIICWTDNWATCPLPVLSLETYVTLAHRTEEASLSWWQKILAYISDLADGWYNMRRRIALAKIENKICPHCGGKMKINAAYSWLGSDWRGDEVKRGRVTSTCSGCGYVSSEYASYYVGLSQ